MEAVDDDVDPLGPLGESSSFNTEEAPAPPQKESSAPTSPPMATASEEDDSGLRGPPPVQPPTEAEGTAKRQSQPSVSVEQAARPTFEISVGDPHKVGDLTSSHIVYQVRTKVISFFFEPLAD